MSISISFYNYTGDPRKAKKELGSAVHTTTAHPLDSVGTLTASYQLTYSAAVMSANYFEADGKKYRITERTRDTAQGMTVTGREDALATFYSAVSSCDAIAARNENKYDMMYGDSKFMTKQKKIIDTVDLGSVGEGDTIIFGYIE